VECGQRGVQRGREYQDGARHHDCNPVPVDDELQVEGERGGFRPMAPGAVPRLAKELMER
jgi:hypothetical protein